MVGVSELMGEKEIIFPEMAALTIGMWIVDKSMYLVRVLGDMPTSLPDHIDSTDISLYAPDPFRDGELGISDSRDGYVVGGRWRTKVDGEK